MSAKQITLDLHEWYWQWRFSDSRYDRRLLPWCAQRAHIAEQPVQSTQLAVETGLDTGFVKLSVVDECRRTMFRFVAARRQVWHDTGWLLYVHSTYGTSGRRERTMLSKSSHLIPSKNACRLIPAIPPLAAEPSRSRTFTTNRLLTKSFGTAGKPAGNVNAPSRTRLKMPYSELHTFIADKMTQD